MTNVVPVLGKFTDPALPARDVDVAFFHDVLHHVENRAAYLKSVAGYLKPGGRIVVIEFNPGDSPHKAEPELIVSKEQTAGWMACWPRQERGHHAVPRTGTSSSTRK